VLPLPLAFVPARPPTPPADEFAFIDDVVPVEPVLLVFAVLPAPPPPTVTVKFVEPVWLEIKEV
jgi:hypothetical protein